MKLYDLIKDRINDPKGVISDNEMCLVNRRDFLFSETSVAKTILGMYRASNVTYEMYSILDFLYTYLCRVDEKSHIRIFQLSQTMTLPALAMSVIFGGRVDKIEICLPRGNQKISPNDEYAKIMAERFTEQVQENLNLSDIGNNERAIDILLCNASNEAEVVSGLNAFKNVKKGLILIKGYGKFNAPNCGEITTASGMNVHCSLAGFGFVSALS